MAYSARLNAIGGGSHFMTRSVAVSSGGRISLPQVKSSFPPYSHSVMKEKLCFGFCQRRSILPCVSPVAVSSRGWMSPPQLKLPFSPHSHSVMKEKLCFSFAQRKSILPRVSSTKKDNAERSGGSDPESDNDKLPKDPKAIDPEKFDPQSVPDDKLNICILGGFEGSEYLYFKRCGKDEDGDNKYDMRAPIILKTQGGKLTKLADLEIFWEMDRRKVLSALHRLWCAYMRETPHKIENLTLENVWPGYKVSFLGLFTKKNQYMELHFDGFWETKVECVLIERAADMITW